MKDIIIIANFCDYESLSSNNRFNYIQNMLYQNGYNVELITSTFSHKRKKQRDLVNKSNRKVTLIFEPGYKKNVSLKRFYSHFIFGKNLFKYIKDRKEPDVIYCAVPSLTGPYLIGKFCKKNNIKFIIDIQDLWPEAFKMIFSPFLIERIIYFPFNLLANKIYSMADSIVAVSDTYINRAKTVCNKFVKCYTVYLGTNVKTFDEYKEKYQFTKTDDEIILGYCGTLGSSYDIKCVIDSLDILNKEGVKAPKFLVMGDGPLKDEFKKYALMKHVDCEFTGQLPYDRMCGMISTCDFVVNPISHGAAQSIINKHADYAAAGVPVLNTQECDEYRNLVSEYNMGFNCKNHSAIDLAKHIKILMVDKDLRIRMGNNARKCAEEKFNRQTTYRTILKLLKSE